MLQDLTFWFGVSFILFMFVFWFAVRKPILQMLDDYSARVKAEMDEAAQIYAEARLFITDVQMKNTNAGREIDGILNSARQQAQLIREHAERDLDVLLERREKQALERITILEDQMAGDVRRHAVDTAMKAAEYILRTRLDASADSAIIDGQINTLAAGLKKVA